MKRITTTLAALALALPAYAQHGGAGAKVGVGANADIRTGTGATLNSATLNSNAGGELRGQERAETRRSARGNAHEKATVAHAKHKGKTARADLGAQAKAGATAR